MGEEKHMNKIPQNPGTIPWKFCFRFSSLYVFFFTPKGLGQRSQGPLPLWYVWMDVVSIVCIGDILVETLFELRQAHSHICHRTASLFWLSIFSGSESANIATSFHEKEDMRWSTKRKKSVTLPIGHWAWCHETLLPSYLLRLGRAQWFQPFSYGCCFRPTVLSVRNSCVFVLYDLLKTD